MNQNSQSAVISGILLAAGEGKRMGALKQTLPLGNATILEKSLGNLISSKIAETIVVLGYKASEIQAKLANLPVNIILNPDYREGLSTSIIAGIKAISPQTEAIMILLADQPYVESNTINLLLKEYLSHHKGIVIPVYQGQRGHPVIISLKYRRELLALRGDIGARGIIARHPEDILEVAVNSPGIILDLDTPEAYNKQRNNLR